MANDRKQIDAELLRKIPPIVNGGGGYILHSDHSIPPEVDHDTLVYFLERGREIGTPKKAAAPRVSGRTPAAGAKKAAAPARRKPKAKAPVRKQKAAAKPRSRPKAKRPKVTSKRKTATKRRGR
ncbi:MAG: hypothetical protein A2487_14730 [Candidatus Raymondbacteria bacterium RifOxyC12_full_50_8]|nr:MAG: hypothetical protein A2487_14730 [Candidatus Raymondbacteria bacterium RifOxyC12_full_50_8]